MNIIYKTIKTRNRHYVYDRNANRILSIDESDYNKLLEQEKKIDKEFDDNFIRKFQEKGFLLENQLEIIENPLTRYSEHILHYDFPLQIKENFSPLVHPNAATRIASMILTRDGFDFPVYFIALKIS